MGDEIADLWLALFQDAVRGEGPGFHPTHPRPAAVAELSIFQSPVSDTPDVFTHLEGGVALDYPADAE